MESETPEAHDRLTTAIVDGIDILCDNDRGDMQITPDEPLAPPIFILSCERSGSTLLRYIIDSHSEICCPGELGLGALGQALAMTLARTVGQVWNNTDLSLTNGIALQEARKIISGIMNTYTIAKGKRHWCDKTPFNLSHLDIIEGIFPDAKYICLYRSCLDVVHSCIESARYGFMQELAPYVSRTPHNFIAAMMESWVEKTELLIDFERKKNPQSISVRYEDLVRNTEATMITVFEFLGVAWEPGLLDRVFSIEHDFGGGDLKIRKTDKINSSSIGLGKRIPLASVPPKIRSKAESLNAMLGYVAL